MNKLIIVLLACLILSASKIYSQAWTQTGSIPQGAGVTDMVVMNDGTLIVTTASYNWPSGQQGGIRRSSDEGNNWQNVINAYNARTLYLGTSGRLFASCWMYPANEGMFFSSNNGLNWTQTYFGPANDNVFSIAAKNDDSMVFIGTRNGVWRSFNNGAWIQRITGLPANSWVRDISISSGGIILIATTNGVFRSSNHGNDWIPSGNGIPATDTIISVSKFTNNGKVFCASSSGKAYSSEAGSFVWTQVFSQRSEKISKIDIVDLTVNIFMIMISNIFEEALDDMNYSTDEGETWEGTSIGVQGSVSSFGLKMLFRTSSVRAYSGLFLNTQNGAKIFKADLNVGVGVNQISSEIPDSYSLKQNYPNPFNPATKIKFDISPNAKGETQAVRLIIYNALGRQVDVLVNEKLSTGSYEVDWNAGNYNSGIYFYELTTDGFTETRKMILTK